jgi:Phage phiEco32-like COOH.NH2 ligase-type 2
MVNKLPNIHDTRLDMFDCPRLGADPEIFFKSGNKLLPAYEFLPSKDKGKPWNYMCSDGSRYQVGKMYWDGFQAEYSMKHGYDCPALMTMYQQYALKALLQAAQRHDNNARLVLENVVKIPTDILKNGNEEHIALGCLPSMNAYEDSGIHVSNPRELAYRFAGGHVHLGYDKDVKVNKVETVKNLDKILGIWAVGAAQNWDNPIRRKYYGKAGEYRQPKHGLEYRVLSNFFLSSPYIFEMVYEIARAVYRMSYQDSFLKLWLHDENLTRIAINECDAKLATGILQRNKNMFKFLLSFTTLSPMVRKLIYEVGMYGIEYVLKTPDDFVTHWHLDSDEQWEYEKHQRFYQLGYGVKNKLLVAQKG